MKLHMLVVVSTLAAGCSKKSESESQKTKPVEPAKVEPAKAKVTLANLKLTGDWQATYTESLDYWTASKRVTGLSGKSDDYYQYRMMIMQAAADTPTTEAELAAKAIVPKGLQRNSRFFKVDKTQAVSGGAAVIGPHGDNDADPTKADKGFIVVRDLGATKIICTSTTSRDPTTPYSPMRSPPATATL